MNSDKPLVSYRCTKCTASFWYHQDSPPIDCPSCCAQTQWEQTSFVAIEPKLLMPQLHVMIDYTNHAGVRAIREIVPLGLRFGSTEWHHEPQYLLDAHDVAKDDMRTFAMKDVHAWAPTGTATGRSMASYAKQLQASIERNVRTGNRLHKLVEILNSIDNAATEPTDLFIAVGLVQSILKDEEPTWPAA